jgi:hypothetical protein
MRRILGWVGVAVLVIIAVLSVALPRPPLSRSQVDTTRPIKGADTTLVRVRLDSTRRFLDLVVGPIVLANREQGHRASVQIVSVPLSAWVQGFTWFVEDGHGQRLPDDFLHHFNLVDPDRAELFSPVARRVMAAGRETAGQDLPPIIGYPLTAGSRFLIVSMLKNPASQQRTAFLTIRLQYVPERHRLVRPLAVYPFFMDVMGNVGGKEFAVPPGRTIRAWEGSPRTSARILALGGHLHDHARKLELTDVTTGKTLWSIAPQTENGRVTGVPRAMVFHRGGIKLRPDHRYRVSVEYYNPGLTPSPHRGMGVVAGIVATTQAWPPLDSGDSEYTQDLHNLLKSPLRPSSAHGMHR